jgi:hypothetical protein
MSWVVKLEDELGERGDWVMLHGVVPAFDEREFPLLRCIDPYGRTVFNHLQMDLFIGEWDRVKERARDDSQTDAWGRIRQMAETCRNDRDLYLKFVGN